MDGVLNVHKHDGPTSHDIVYEVRRIYDQKKVGHAGTLDPMATGVLVVCLGKATRIVEYLMGTQKEYRAKLIFGRTTDTEDSTGTVLEERKSSGVTQAEFTAAVAGFVGEIEQVPPMISAIKYQGKPLYKHAREGKTIERQPRKITIHSIEISAFTPGEYAEAEIVVTCSSGTYIRTLCADIGEKLGCGAYMSMLERTAVGRFRLEDAVSIEQLREAREQGKQADYLLDISNAISDMPSVTLNPEEIRNVLHGLPGSVTDINGEGDTYKMLSLEGDLIGLGYIERIDQNLVVKPRKVFAEVDS